MATVTISPNMLLPVPVPTQDPGPDWANNLYACLYSQVDAHDHSNGKGVQITPDGLNVNSDLTFQSNSATHLLSTQYVNQSAALSGSVYPATVYVAGGNLWYNSVSGAQVQVTAGSVVNATSSGISSGTATASFVSSVLVVNAAPNTPADLQGGSYFMGNNVANSKHLKISPPNAMAADYTLVMPALPGSTSFLTLDTSGNITGSVTTTGGITATNIANSTITGSKIASATVTGSNIANSTVTNLQLAPVNIVASSPITANNSGVTTPLDIPGSTINITNVGGRPFLVYLNAGLSTTDSYSFISNTAGGTAFIEGRFRILKSINNITYSPIYSTLQVGTTAAGTALPQMPFALSFVDTAVVAGTNYYYKLSYTSVTSNTPMGITNCTFNAQEL